MTSPSTRAATTGTPSTSNLRKAFSATSPRAQSRFQAMRAPSTAPSDRVMRALVEPARVEIDGPLGEERPLRAEAEAVVVFADEEELRLAGVEMRVDAVEHRAVADEGGGRRGFRSRRVEAHLVDGGMARQPAVIRVVQRQHLDRLGESRPVLLVPGHLLADLGAVGLDAVGEI